MSIQPIASPVAGGDIFSRYKQQQEFLSKHDEERQDSVKSSFHKLYDHELRRLGNE